MLTNAQEKESAQHTPNVTTPTAHTTADVPTDSQ